MRCLWSVAHVQSSSAPSSLRWDNHGIGKQLSMAIVTKAGLESRQRIEKQADLEWCFNFFFFQCRESRIQQISILSVVKTYWRMVCWATNSGCWGNKGRSLEELGCPYSCLTSYWGAQPLPHGGCPSPRLGLQAPQNSSSKFFVQLQTESCKSVPLFSVACTLPLIQFPFCLFSVQPHSAWQLFNKPICFSLTWGRSCGCWRAIRP